MTQYQKQLIKLVAKNGDRDLFDYLLNMIVQVNARGEIKATEYEKQKVIIAAEITTGTYVSYEDYLNQAMKSFKLIETPVEKPIEVPNKTTSKKKSKDEIKLPEFSQDEIN